MPARTQPVSPSLSAEKPGTSSSRWRWWLVLFLLLAVPLAVFWQVVDHGYVSYDDGDYVSENKIVQKGLTTESVLWAFTSVGYAANWHPLTWLSHMLDWQLHGNKPGRHHFTSVLVHCANGLLVFFLLWRLTGKARAFSSLKEEAVDLRLPVAAFAAFLFALHPLHVESVAWLAERKDVLSTFFGLLALLAYVAYAETHSPASRVKMASWYGATLLLFAASLMSKPMLVTFPFLLLLLDFWPLRRLRGNAHSMGRIFIEKVPFLLLSVASCVVTVQAQQGQTIQSLANFSVLDRVSNVLVAYATYLGKMVWPAKLAFFYPLIEAPPLWQAALAGSLLAGLTVLLLFLAKRFPIGLLGWCWYLGTLVPVIGLVHVGEQSHADRYTYLPSIGIFWALSWVLAKWIHQFKMPRWSWALLAGCAVAACSLASWKQIGYWKDNRAMLERALAVTDRNFLAHNNYGVILAEEGKLDQAIEHYGEATRIKPFYARAYENWGTALTLRGDLGPALEMYEKALRMNPGEARTHHNIAVTLARQEKYEQAIEHCRQALRLKPDYFVAYYDLALALSLSGKREEAIAAFGEYLKFAPDDGLGHLHLASALSKTGDVEKAIVHYREAVRLRPELPNAHYNLAWILATHAEERFRDGAVAVTLAERAVELTKGEHAYALAILAAAYAESGRYANAVAAAEKSIALCEASGRADLAGLVRQQRQLYEAGRSHRE